MFKQLLDTNKTLFFLFLCICTWLLLFIKKSFVEYETTAFLVLEQEGKLGLFHLISTLQYLSVPLVYLFKFTIISFLLWIGSFTFGYRILFKQIFGVVIVAETIFLLPEAIKIIYFLNVGPDENFFVIKAFYPLSLMHFYDPFQLEPRFHYPAKALNLFEIFYWLILTRFMYHLSRKKWDIAIYVVFVFYVMFFLIWMWFYISVYK